MIVNVACREYRGQQICSAGAIAAAVQGAGHQSPVADHVGNAADDLIDLSVHTAGHPITGTGVQKAEDVNARIPIQNLAAAGGPVAFTDVVAFVQRVFSLVSGRVLHACDLELTARDA